MRYPHLPKALKECVAQNVLTGFPTCTDCTSKAEALEFGVDERHYCDGKNCFTREKRADYEYRLELIEGLQFPEVIDQVAIPTLDSTIISYNFDAHLAISRSVYGSAIGVPYWRVPDLLSRKSVVATDFRSRFGLDKDQLLVLHGEGQDNELEKLFRRSCDPRFFEACASLSPVLLIAPGYSVYSDGSQCRRWQPYNLKCSAKFFSDANNHGLPCIPWIASNHNRDTERICEWLNNQHQTICYIAVNFQTKGSKVLNENIRFAKTIETASTRKIHWLIFGIASEASMRQVAQSLTGELTFVTSKPIQRGGARRSIYNRPLKGEHQVIVDKNVQEQHRLTEKVLSSRNAIEVHRVHASRE